MARLLFVTEKYAPEIGGLARSSDRIARALAGLGHHVELFTLSRQLDSGQATSDLVSERLIVHRFGGAKAIDFTLQQAMTFFEWLHQSRSQPFDLVWSHYAFHNGFLGVWFAKHFGLKSILAVRGNDVDRQLFPPGDFSRLLWMLQNASEVVAVSKDLAAKVQTLSHRSPQVIYNAVDAAVFRPEPRNEVLSSKYQIKTGDLVLVFSGELRAKKGLTHLLECFRLMNERRPTRLLIIGEIRPQEQGLFERESVRLGDARQRIIVTGHLPTLDEVAEHLRLGDVFLLPSLWDGLPNSLLEAMATGIPVIASDAGAIAEILHHGHNGILVPKTHLHQMANQIEWLFTKPASERNAMTDAARQSVADHFRPESEAQQLRELINGVLSKAS